MPRYSRVVQHRDECTRKKPEWLRVRYPAGQKYERTAGTLKQHNLHTVCEEANCPNVAECWDAGTATFMLMGDVCTRTCPFCMVKSGNPQGVLDEHEPHRIAKAIADLGLRYVVLTSVDRDDLLDGGAEHFATTIKAVKQYNRNVVTEALIPDFRGNINHLKKIVEAEPEVIAHNVETTERLTPMMRDRRASYAQSLQVLDSIKKLNSKIYSKSSIMLGLGETEGDLLRTMMDLRNANVDILTLGQYLRPTREHAPVHQYVEPDKFHHLKETAQELGFLFVAAGPFVRSSYRAGELFLEGRVYRI
jgi:lipoyl synthase